MKKILWFEGAGCVERGDVENCRIRTAFMNDEGKRYYLELIGMEVTRHSPERYNRFFNVGIVDYCYELGKDGGRFDIGVNRQEFEYNKKNILKIVNNRFGCSFDEIKITDMFFGYRVHKSGGGYNFMEDYNFDEAKADACRVAYNAIDMQIRERLCEKWSKISLHEIGEDSITVRCYASDKSMEQHGLDPNQRFFTVNIW